VLLSLSSKGENMDNTMEAVRTTVAAPDEHQGEVVNSESTPEQTSTTDSVDGGENDAADKPKKKHWAYDRIDELTRKYRTAQRDAEMWKAKAEAPAPKQDQFEDYDDYMAAKTVHTMNIDTAQTRVQEANLYLAETFEERQAIARDKYPDYDAVAHAPTVSITADMAEVIQSSEYGPEIAYHLGKNPSEARRISMLPVKLQAAELGKMEARLTLPQANRKHPPEPVDTVSAIAAGGSKDPSKMSMAEYVEARKAGKI
jgi:hypothetical protein